VTGYSSGRTSELAIVALADIAEKLHIAFGEKEHVVFQGFKAADLTSALALLEHLTADS